MIAARKIRCAIYTRKSTTTGLEKDFNTKTVKYKWQEKS
jgi:hypothetical protein